jgi:hypothetical protein
LKTEFNVERICDRVHLCVVDSPDHLGPPFLEINFGSMYITFPEAKRDAAVADATVPQAEPAADAGSIPAAAQPAAKRRGKNAQG